MKLQEKYPGGEEEMDSSPSLQESYPAWQDRILHGYISWLGVASSAESVLNVWRRPEQCDQYRSSPGVYGHRPEYGE